MNWSGIRRQRNRLIFANLCWALIACVIVLFHEVGLWNNNTPVPAQISGFLDGQMSMSHLIAGFAIPSAILLPTFIASLIWPGLRTKSLVRWLYDTSLDAISGVWYAATTFMAVACLAIWCMRPELHTLSMAFAFEYCAVVWAVAAGGFWCSTTTFKYL